MIHQNENTDRKCNAKDILDMLNPLKYDHELIDQELIDVMLRNLKPREYVSINASLRQTGTTFTMMISLTLNLVNKLHE